MEPAKETIVLTDSRKSDKSKFDIKNLYETTLEKLKVKVSAIKIRRAPYI